MILRSREPTFDEAPDLTERGNISLVPGLELTDEEYDDALLMANYSKGVMIVTGEPGSGKDLFGNTIAWKNKRYFGRKILRDEPPRRLFGDYAPFSMSTINEDLEDMHDAIKEMDEINKNDRETNRSKIRKMNSLAKEWLEIYGESILRDAVMYIVEFSGWMSNRNPMAPINIFMGQILRRWRHYDLLVIGTTQYKSELDKTTCLPYVSHEVRCSWSKYRPNTGNYSIYGVRSVTSTGVINVSRKVVRYRIDGMQPREALGEEGYFKLFNSKS